MSKVESFEDLEVWVLSQNLAKDMYALFSASNDFGFKDQICRAAVSISNNIAEGFERQSNKELSRFLYISKGSCAEVRSMIYLAYDLGYINKLQKDKLIEDSKHISRKLSVFISRITHD